MKNLRLLIGLFAALVFFTCKKEDAPQNSSLDLGSVVEASFVGQVVDENNLPIAEATAQIGSFSVKTDANGVFILKNQSVHSKRAIVSFSKTGFWPSSKTLFVAANSTNNLKIRLLKKEVVGSLTGSAGGKINLPNSGPTLDFPANSISKNGAVFSGKINVAARWLNPKSATLFEEMPGALRGISTKNEEQVLATFGMVGVELTDETGNELEVAAGQTVEISMPIPTDLQAKAPQTIPLWHFSDSEGIWVEDGSAEKTGDKYVGRVSHFSWWNCDAGFPTVELKLCLKDLKGNPMGNTAVFLTIVSSGWVSSATTDENGCVMGLVPKGEVMKMSIFVSCGEFFIQNVGPLSSDTDLGAVTVQPAQTASYTIHGKLIDCDNNAVSNGYLTYKTGGSDSYRQYIYLSADGSFSFTQIYCLNNPPSGGLIYNGYDLTGQKVSDEQTIAFSNDMDLGTIQVCNSNIHYIQYTLDGTNYLISGYTEGDAYGTISGIYINPADSSQVWPFLFKWQNGNGNPIIGTFKVYDIKCNGLDLAICPVNAHLQLTEIEPVGQSMIGTFNATFIDAQNGLTHTIAGDFNVRRGI